jgi:hypothetical protein
MTFCFFPIPPRSYRDCDTQEDLLFVAIKINTKENFLKKNVHERRRTEHKMFQLFFTQFQTTIILPDINR